jgi:hypothetical protein
MCPKKMHKIYLHDKQISSKEFPPSESAAYTHTHTRGNNNLNTNICVIAGVWAHFKGLRCLHLNSPAVLGSYRWRWKHYHQLIHCKLQCCENPTSHKQLLLNIAQWYTNASTNTSCWKTVSATMQCSITVLSVIRHSAMQYNCTICYQAQCNAV